MICIRCNNLPLIQQLERITNLLSNGRWRVRAQSHANGNFPPLCDAALRQNINYHFGSLHHIAQLVVVHPIQHCSHLSGGRLFVFLDNLLTLGLCTSIKKTCAKVSWLDHRHSNPQWGQFSMHSLGNATACPFGSSIESITGITVPGADTSEVGNGPVASGGADVRKEGFGDIEHAKDIGVELIEVLFGAVAVSNDDVRGAGPPRIQLQLTKSLRLRQRGCSQLRSLGG